MFLRSLIQFVQRRGLPLLLILFFSSHLGTAWGKNTVGYFDYFSHSEHYFMIKPAIIKELFLKTVSLKGASKKDQERSERIIRIFTLSPFSKQVFKESKQSPMPRYFTLKVPIKYIEILPQSANRKRVEVRFDWFVEKLAFDHITVDYFYFLLGVADDSIYYERKINNLSIFFRALVPSHAVVLMEKKIARSLIAIQKKILRFHISLTLGMKGMNYEIHEDNLNNILVDLALPAVKLTINERDYYRKP